MVWLSLDPWIIAALSAFYLLILFSVAYWAQKPANRHWVNKPWIYSLSLGVSCTSWAFYGTVGQASMSGEWIAPIYLGTIGFFILGWPVLLKMLRVSKQQNISSIADFIASRYERFPQIAGFVTLIALIGTIPYISLQLRAISQSFDLVTGSYQSGISTTFIVTCLLILFSIFFGARDKNVSTQNPGLVLAIAFSSLFKLLIFLITGLFISFFLFDGIGDILTQYDAVAEVSSSNSAYFTLSQMLIGALTIFISPQLYHMIVIENNGEKALQQARWQYPLYLILINLFVLPIALAGEISFPGGSVNADTYILTLPLFHQQAWLSGLVFIGGVAAATAMVIVAAIVLSTMLTTEVLTPFLLKSKRINDDVVSTRLLTFRRVSIAIILLLGLSFERLVDAQSHLTNLGILAFVLLAQLAPPVIGALYWRRGTSLGAISGLLVGSLVWAGALLLPMLSEQFASTMDNTIFPLISKDIEPLTQGIFLSLILNTVAFVLVSLNSKRTVSEQFQADIFLTKQHSKLNYALTIKDIVTLLRRFTDDATADKIQQSDQYKSYNQQASQALIDYCQNKLANVLGSASARLVMKAATNIHDPDIALEQVADIVDEANQIFEFNRELLQAGVENIDQGISVVNAEMKLVAWNKRYLELLDYPQGFVKAGLPIAELIRFNIERGIIEGDDIQAQVDKRLQHMRVGDPHKYQRILPSGTVLDIRGQAMPGGGFVTTFTDITKHVENERALQQANLHLEQRVLDRTQELERAKAEAEAANTSKTRFLAAASHDLMQPFNAMSLFTDILKQKLEGSEHQLITEQIQHSLSSVEGLLSDLVEISKLDSFIQKTNPTPFSLDEVLDPLADEMKAIALQANVEFSYVKTSLWVNTDKPLLRRLVQNLLANAVHYCPLGMTDKAKVTLGVKRRKDQLEICVFDNGPGIPSDKQTLIFKEFERLESNHDKPGLGLGLAISDRIAKLLAVSIKLTSQHNKGACFSVTLDQAPAISQNEISEHKTSSKLDLTQVNILIIDNEPMLLEALKAQLEQWGCSVIALSGRKMWQQIIEQPLTAPQIIIADYHLDDNDNGVDLAQTIISHFNSPLPCIICSADPSEHLRQRCSDAKFSFLKKPIKGLALKRLLKQQMQS